MDKTKKELETSLKRSKELQKNYESSQQALQQFRERNKELETQLKPSILNLLYALLSLLFFKLEKQSYSTVQNSTFEIILLDHIYVLS